MLVLKAPFCPNCGTFPWESDFVIDQKRKACYICRECNEYVPLEIVEEEE